MTALLIILGIIIYLVIGIFVMNFFVQKQEGMSLYRAIDEERNRELSYSEDSHNTWMYYVDIFFFPIIIIYYIINYIIKGFDFLIKLLTNKKN